MGDFDPIETAIAAFGEGRMVVVVDDPDRENEGDLCMAASRVTADAINFMVTHARGLICLPLTPERVEALDLPLMVTRNSDRRGTAFTVSIDALEGTTTGISAHDRALTIQKAIDPQAKPEDFARPGHIFPLQAREGGVLKRAGHTEAAVDLARLAGLPPAGVICEIMRSDGTMARVPDLIPFARKHGLPIVTIADLIRYRRRNERQIRRVGEANLPTRYGSFRAVAYEDLESGQVHLAVVKGTVDDGEPTLVRVHSECLTGDALGSLRCDCGPQLSTALARIEEEGKGVVLYLRQEGRGIGLGPKIQAYGLQDQGKDTVEANLALGYPPDLRDFGTGAQILADLGLHKIIVMTNNPRKLRGLEGYGLEIVGREPLAVGVTEENRRYLDTKRTKLGHLFSLDDFDPRRSTISTEGGPAGHEGS